MEKGSLQDNHSQVAWTIKAPRMAVYQAFLDPKAVAAWLAPDDMQGHVHHFEPCEGGRFRISLEYQNPKDYRRGKTSASTDTYHGRFTRLIPGELVEESIEFESEDPKLAGEMKMIVRLADVTGGTEVILRFENMPSGIRAEDNESGSIQSLKKLAKLLEK